MTELTHLTLKQTIDEVRNKKVSAQEVETAYYEKVKAEDAEVHAYLHLIDPSTRTSRPGPDSTLAGLPLAIKDNFCTVGLPTTASSAVLANFMPQYESTVTRKLLENGAVIQGKTNMDAWAHGSSTETSDFGATKNPRNLNHSPGGSSGGSAAAVAADFCPAAIGSETAGSIRLPASWCGTVGLKPTYGRVSRYGVVAMASSTDSPGPITKTVEDAALLLNCIAGHDPYDGTSSKQPTPDYTTALKKSVKGYKVGAIYFDLEGLSQVKAIYERELKVLEELGVTIEFVNAMDPNFAISVYTIIQRGEVSSNLARYDGVRYGTDRSQFGSEAYNRIMTGTFTLSAGYADRYYHTAQSVRSLFIQDFVRLFSMYDLLIAPTTPSYAVRAGASEESALFGELMDMLVEASSIVGLPGINVPAHHDTSTNLFLGFDIIAPMWHEEKMISLAHAYETATTHSSWRSEMSSP